MKKKEIGKKILDLLYRLLLLVLALLGALGLLVAIELKFWIFILIMFAASLISLIIWHSDSIFRAICHIAQHFLGEIGLCSLLAILWPSLSEFPRLWGLIVISVILFNILEILDYWVL